MSHVTPPTSHYWLMIGSAPQGPFDAGAIRSKLSTGEISSDTQACPLGGHTWLPVTHWISVGSQSEIDDRIQLNDRRRHDVRSGYGEPPLPPPPAITPTATSASPWLALGGFCLCVVGIAAVIGFLLWWPFGPSGYNLANRNLPKGTIIRNETSYTMTDGTVTYTAIRQVTGKVTVQTLEITESEILEIANGEPTKVKINFISDTSTGTIKLAPDPDIPISENGPFHGRAILAEKVGGIWKQSLVGIKATPAQARALQTEWTLDDVYPDRQVKRGESWKVEGARLRRLVGMSDVLTFEGSGTFTLDDIVMRSNEKCALIHVQMSIKARSLDDQNHETSTEMAVTGHVYRSLSRFVDVESECTGQMKYSGTIIEQGQPISVNMAGITKIQTRQSRR